ncbi:MAG: S-methyl-5-thioribose-1-phosphate isomerase [Wenzhouxiangellaceae bacterium]
MQADSNAHTTPTLDVFTAVRWCGTHLQLLDQRRLPHAEVWLDITDLQQAIAAIQSLVVRGAPAIGITAAYACVLAARKRATRERAAGTDQDWPVHWRADCQRLLQARPTAVNLRWAIASMQQVLDAAGIGDQVQAGVDVEALLSALAQRAVQIQQDDLAANQRLAELGSALLDTDSTVLTHCNTGALATAGVGTAIGVIVQAHAQGKLLQVYADETRPWLQGSRLTEWELHRLGVPCQVIIDAAAAWLMASKQVDWLIVGADRVAANGDVANKIGTYQAMLVARHHGVKTMVVVPWSTVDVNTASGAEIEIELRDSDEVLAFQGQRVARAGSTAWNPVFDVTPAALVDYLVTERGVIAAPDRQKLLAMQQQSA